MQPSSDFFMPFVKLAAPFWHSENKTVIRAQSLAFIVLTIMQIGMAVLVNQWSADLFNALEQHSMPGFFRQIGLLVLIFVGSMAITTSHLLVKRQLLIGWRRWLTERITRQWMDKGHHYQITHMQGDHDNPDSRIAEDIRIATEEAIGLGHSLFYSLLLLGSFTTILWNLSGTVTIPFIGLTIYGHLVWIAIIYAIGASTLGWWIGQPLTKATNYRQSMEANFRYGLIKARENSQAIALIYGEANEQQRFKKLFQDIVLAYQQQTSAWAQITLFTSGYSILSMAFPILISAPRFILGNITLGALMQSAQAFQQMASALSWPVDNMAGVANWRASVERVLSLVNTLDALEQQSNQQDPHRIVLEKADHSILCFHDLSIETSTGEPLVSAINAEIKLGERILISADASTGAKLFKVIAGLWPWGTGKVELPDGDPMFFMPPHPYLPDGNLRDAICYPKDANLFSNDSLKKALDLAGLPDLYKQLEKVDAWDQSLSREEQQRLGLARLLIYKPKWILLQEAFDSLDPESEAMMLRLVCEQLPDATVLTVTNHCTLQGHCAELHHRQIKL